MKKSIILPQLLFANFCFDKRISVWSVENPYSNFKMSPLHIYQRFSLKILVFWSILLNWYLELNWNCCSCCWTGKTSLLSKSEYILLQTRYRFQKFEAMQSVDLVMYTWVQNVWSGSSPKRSSFGGYHGKLYGDVLS